MKKSSFLLYELCLAEGISQVGFQLHVVQNSEFIKARFGVGLKIFMGLRCRQEEKSEAGF